MWRGVELLRAVPEGAHVPGRWTLDRRWFSEQAEYLDADGHPQARRDQAVRAARRLARLEDAVTRYEAQRAYDDPLVMAEYELTGDAFTGTVTARDEDRFVPGGRPGSRLWRPTITLRTDTRVGLAVGKKIKSPARPDQGARILDVRQEDDGGCTVVLQLEGGFAKKRTPPAPGCTLAETGEELTYTTLNPTAMPSALPDEADTPWTHGGPPHPYEPTAEDAEETWE